MKTPSVRATIQGLYLRFNHHAARTAKSRTGEHALPRLSLPLVLLATAVALSAGTCRADIQTGSGLVEFMMDTQGLFFSALGVSTGVNGTQTVTGTGYVNSQNGTFNWATDSGAQFEGQSLSFTMAGEMDSAGNGVNAGGGSFGGDIAGDAGDEKQSGDTANTDQTIEFKGKKYPVKGKIKYTSDKKLSSATITVDGKEQTACDTQTVEHPSGTVKTTWGYPCEPQEAALKFNLNIDNTIDSSGYDSFTATLSPVPEPSSLLLFGSGILGLGGFLRKRLLTRT